MKRLKAAVVAAAVVAGTAVAATPAHALSYCNVGSGTIICEYGIASYRPSSGRMYQFAIGTDRAAYVRWENGSGGWTNWSSMGGEWRSGVIVRNQQLPGQVEFGIIATGTDNLQWVNWYMVGSNWTGWGHLPDPV
ncbi:hypothetical protein ACWD6K_17315 [Streptomyces sp. NPDC002431]|uniref:hypothetical protein n=1 Tax=Streptomyces sp. NPDC015144 TaxID=3364944 RepID=UPI0036F95315